MTVVDDVPLVQTEESSAAPSPAQLVDRKISRPARPKKAVRLRRSFEIHAYVGPNGGGKTLCMIRDTLPSLAAGRPVLSTVRLLDPATGEPHPLWHPLTEFRQLLEFEGGDVLLDEVTGIASSRDSMSLPGPVALFLQQLRKRDITLRWSAPAWARADSIIRECSKAVTQCLGFMPESLDEGDDRLWRPRRLFYWRSYDAVRFGEWDQQKRLRIKPFAREIYWRPGKVEQDSYDTLDQVLRIGQVGAHGICMDCEGTRRRVECSCPEYVAAKPVRTTRRSGSGTAE